MLATTPQRRQVNGSHGPISFLEAGAGTPLVLLHGIGGCADAWQAQWADFAPHYRVIAWDAPGYGASAPLVKARPCAADYAEALAALFAAADIQAPHLLGHSLGAILATAWSVREGARARSLLLASPARGYGAADAATRHTVYAERTDMLAALGVEGLAEARAARLCAPDAAPAVLRRVRDNMTRVTPGGYHQAAWLLANSVLREQLPRPLPPALVLCGSEDRITAPRDCAGVAEALGSELHLLPGVGHACYVEAASAFNAEVLAFLHSIDEDHDHE